MLNGSFNVNMESLGKSKLNITKSKQMMLI